MAEQTSLEARAGTAAGNSTDRMESPRLVPETARAEASKAEPVRLDGGVADAFKVDPPCTAGKIFVASTTNRVRENRAASPKVDPVKTDASKLDMSKVEIPRVGKIGTASSVDRSWDSKSSSAKAAAEAGKAAQPLKQDVSKTDPAKAGAPRMAGRPKLSVSRIVGQLVLAALPMARALVSWRPGSASPNAASPKAAASPKTVATPKAVASPKADVRAEARSIWPEKPRMSSLAAVAAIAAAAGALGGVVATSLFSQSPGEAAMTTSDNGTLEASVARIDSDLQALKTGTVQGGQPSQMGQGPDNQTSERIDRLERAEADSSAMIVRLNEATERLRVAVQSTPGMAPIPPVPPVIPRERETTGSATQTSTAASAFGAVRPAALTPKPVDAGKLPVVQGWSLRDVNHGLALIEGRNGFYEVYAGDPIPGLGRVDSIKRQDGRWVVVTTKGLVVSR